MNEASQWIAVWAAGLFSGAALYVSLVEHPARMQCGTVLAVTEFGPSYKRAALMQSILALLGSMGALVAWLAGDGPFWAVGGLLLLFSVPFTLIVIIPTNRRLLDPGLDRSSPEADRLLTRWGRLHWARTAVSLASFGAFVLGLLVGP